MTPADLDGLARAVRSIGQPGARGFYAERRDSGWVVRYDGWDAAESVPQGAEQEADAKAIAAALNSVPGLIDRLREEHENERLAAENAGLREVVLAYAVGYDGADLARDALADMEPDGDWPDAARQLLDRTAPADETRTVTGR